MAKKAKLVRLPRSKVDPESEFVRTLVWVLDMARRGKVRGFAMVYVVESDDGLRTTEAADAFEQNDRLHVLGAMRRMEHNFMKREWET